MIHKSVCICVPCFNNEATIYETLYSIVNQTYRNIKVKVFDNASTDNSLKIIKEYIEKGYDIEIYENTETTTGEENFNRCIRHAEGDYTAIFHSDDVYENTIIEEQVEFLDRTNCLAVATHATIIDSHGMEIGERFVPYEIQNLDCVSFNFKELVSLVFKYGNFITCPTVLFSTKILKNDIVSFRGREFRTSSDLDVWLRVAELGGFGFINKKLIRYRSSESSYSFNLSKVRIHDHDMFLVLDFYMAKFSGLERKKLEKKYIFLLYKDRVKTNINRVMRNDINLKSVDIIGMLAKTSFTRFHFKFLIVGLLYKILMLLPLRKRVFNLIHKFGFLS